ncbi:MAG: thiamine pyrophosphate-dependent enzyme [bacterium]
MNLDLSTNAKITWCPGCPNSAILVAFRKAITELVQENTVKLENIVALSGIGCHGKITDYLNINTFTSLHGRLIPTMTGVKAANPALQVFGFSGDGDSFDEGISHLIHAARRNSDVTLSIHNNQIFALTTGQATPTSPMGFKGRSTPYGSIEEPLNPLFFILCAGATFVARSSARDIEGTKNIMKEAARHKGFSFIEIIQPCISFFDTTEYYKDRFYQLDENYPTDNLQQAMEKVQEVDRTALGIFYRVEKPSFEELLYQ